jgi:uncharacterized protein involved in exopolysaccharide biosynthesis
MENEVKPKEAKFSDHVFVLYKWKKFLFINLFLLLVIGTIYSFLISEKFKATSIITVSQSNSSLGGISSLINGQIGSFGSELLGMANPSQDIIFELLNSRSVLTNVIQKFNLIDYYQISDNNIDKTIKAFRGDLVFEPTDNGMIEVSVINENPKTAADIANYLVNIVDDKNVNLNSEQARNNRIFIEKRYIKNSSDLKSAEDSMYKFQKKYGIFALPEQLEASIKVTAEMEAQFQQQMLAMDMLKIQYGDQSPLYLQSKTQLDFLKEKVNELKSSGKLSYPSNVLFPFSKIPEVSLSYLRLYRDIEIQTKIMEFVLPMYEQAKVEEQKSIPSLVVIDKAIPPQLKYSPKKAFIILLFFFFGLFTLIPIIFVADKSVLNKIPSNPLEVKTKSFFSRLARIYKIDLR